jgi:hypothetical protein
MVDSVACFYCQHPLPDIGFYCPNCQAQVRCKACGEQLLSGAKGCVFCGAALSATGISTSSLSSNDQASRALNRIIIKESKDERTVEAEFTDQVAVDIAGLWTGQYGTSRPVMPRPSIPHTDYTPTAPELAGGVIEVHPAEQEESAADIRQSSALTVWSPLKEIFRYNDGKIVLRDTGLKGKNAKDYRVRATVLALMYMAQFHSRESVPRTDLIDMLQRVDWFDTNFYGELKDRAVFAVDESESVSLLVEGERRAKQYLAEVLDENIPFTPIPAVGKGRRRSSGKAGGRDAEPQTDTSAERSSGTAPRPQAADVKKYVERWDGHASAQHIDLKTLNRLDQVLVALYALQQTYDEEKPIGRYMLEAFLREAFGVTYSARAIADRLAKEDGKKLAIYDRGKGYRLRSQGQARVTSLIGAEG